MQFSQKQTSESSAVQHSSIYRNSEKTFVEEPHTKNSIQVSASQSVKNASQEANSYLGKYSYKKQANNNSLATTAVRKQAENNNLPTLFLSREVQ